MVKTFIFDEASPYWSHSYENNRSFIEMQTRWIYDLINVQGYMYLNRIYENFGVRWNTDESNDCIRYNTNNFILSWADLGDNRFEIRIYY